MKIRVTTPNRMIVVRGLPVRTPVEIDIPSTQEYNFFSTYLKAQCAEFEIIDDNKDSNNIKPKVISKVKSKKKGDITINNQNDSNNKDIPPQIDEDLNNIEENIEPVIEEMGSGKILDKILTD